jgi:hypothetical protein
MPRRGKLAVVRAVNAKVLKGRVVTRARLPEGARLTVFVHEPGVATELDGDDEAAIAAGAAEIRAGQYTSAAQLRAFLRRK